MAFGQRPERIKKANHVTWGKSVTNGGNCTNTLGPMLRKSIYEEKLQEKKVGHDTRAQKVKGQGWE